jgi:hypothetical protein
MNKEAFLNELKNDKVFRLNLLSLLLDDISEYIEVEKDSFCFDEEKMSVRIKDTELIDDIKDAERDKENKDVFNLWIEFWSKVYSVYKIKNTETKTLFFDIMFSLSKIERESFFNKINLELDDIQSLKYKKAGFRASSEYGYDKRFYAFDILNKNRR